MLAAIDPTWLFFAGVVILTTVLVRMTYRRQGNTRPTAMKTSPPDAAPASVSPSYRELLGRLDNKEVEFNDLYREAIARLDNKIAILQRLLSEADATIARLDESTARAGTDWDIRERGKGGEGE